MHFGYAVFDGHGDVLLGDLRRRPRSSVAAIQVYDVRPGVVAAHSDHIHIGRGGDLDGDQCLRVHGLDPVHVFLVVLHRIDAVEGEG